jgi:hypothetical protein
VTNDLIQGSILVLALVFVVEFGSAIRAETAADEADPRFDQALVAVDLETVGAAEHQPDDILELLAAFLAKVPSHDDPPAKTYGDLSTPLTGVKPNN